MQVRRYISRIVTPTQSAIQYDFVFVDQESFEEYSPKSFASLMAGFREYKG